MSRRIVLPGAGMLLALMLGMAAVMTGIGQDCPTGQVLVDGVCGSAALSDLSAGWHQISPGGETTCAHGTPYSYWVRPGETDNLLLYLEGGGGCWNADTCRDNGSDFNGFYTMRVNERNSAMYQSGVFDLRRAENPFSSYTMVYAPVCTGDVHWGDYTNPYSEDVVIEHKGFVNTQSALQWAYDNVPEPDSVFITGCSAGAPGSVMHAPYVAEQYPGVPLAQLGDSLAFVFPEPVDLQAIWHAHDNFASWIPALSGLAPVDWTMAKMIQAVAEEYPQAWFAQYNTQYDEVQVFYSMEDESEREAFGDLLNAHLAAVEAAAPNTRTFTAGGEMHCILGRSQFYTAVADGVRLLDWVAALANHAPLDSVHCAACDQMER